MAQKANKSGAKKAAAAKPARKPSRVQAASSAKAANAKAAKRKTPPPKAPPKGRDKPAPAKHVAAATPAPAKVQLKTTAKPIAKAPIAKPVQAPKTKIAPGAITAAAAATAVRTMPAAVAKLAGQRIVGPAAIKPPTAQPVAAPSAPKKPVNQRHGFKTGEWIVYPAHGVGRISAIEEQEIAGLSLELFVITFEKDKMTLRVPTGKSQSVGMRKLADEPIVKKAMETLKGRARIKRTMWSRRAQEYEAKINSGDLISIAEVVRDLYRSESQPEQSYSERQLYEAALDRMAREIAAVERLDERGAVQRITEVLAKSAKGRRLTAEDTTEIKAA